MDRTATTDTHQKRKYEHGVKVLLTPTMNNGFTFAGLGTETEDQ